jgi:hypothetical protein
MGVGIACASRLQLMPRTGHAESQAGRRGQVWESNFSFCLVAACRRSRLREVGSQLAGRRRVLRNQTTIELLAPHGVRI